MSFKKHFYTFTFFDRILRWIISDQRFQCPEPVILAGEERYPRKNEIIMEGLTIEKTFHIELELILTASNNASQWTNLFHFTTAWDTGIGSRIPG